MRFVEVMICSGRLFFATLLSALPTPSLTQGGQVCSFFSLIFYSGNLLLVHEKTAVNDRRLKFYKSG